MEQEKKSTYSKLMAISTMGPATRASSSSSSNHALQTQSIKIMMVMMMMMMMMVMMMMMTMMGNTTNLKESLQRCYAAY